MKNIRIKICSLVAIIFFVSNCFAAPTNLQNKYSQPEIMTTQQSLQKAFDEAQQKFNFIGISAAVLLPMQQKPLTFTAGRTLIKDGKPITANSLFQVGSTTKTFTAALIARAIKEKHLSPDDKLGKFLPEYPLWKDITINELVNQTSGIFDYINSKDWWINLSINKAKRWDAKSLVNLAYQHPNSFKPETGWEYSNTNYVLLGLILEKVYNKSANDLMASLIKDAKLQQTYYMPHKYPNNIMQQMAHGYFFDNSDGKVYDMTTQDGSIWYAAGAIVSTPADLVSWLNSLFSGNIIYGTSVTNFTKLKNTTTATEVDAFDQPGYTFGLFRMNTPEGLIWITPGLTSGYVTTMMYAPCLDLYVAYSINQASVDLHTIGMQRKLILMSLMHVINTDRDYLNFLHDNIKLPNYCAKIKPAEKFIFPMPPPKTTTN